MGIFGRFMTPLQFSGNMSHGLFDTLVVSFSRYPEFRHLMNQMPPDERSRVIGCAWVSHKEAFYCDDMGNVTKWAIEDDV